MYAMNLLDKSQGHWNFILHLWCLGWPLRVSVKGTYSLRVRTARISYRKRSDLQYYCNSTRFRDNLLHGYAYPNWRIRKLACTNNDRGSRHGLPTDKQHKILIASSVFIFTLHLCFCRCWCWYRLNRLPTVGG